MDTEKKKPAFVYKDLNQQDLNQRKASVIEETLQAATNMGLTDVKGFFDNNTIKVQGKDQNGETQVLTRNVVETNNTSRRLQYPRHHNQLELEQACAKLAEAGYIQVQIAQMLGISQSRVSQIMKKIRGV